MNNWHLLSHGKALKLRRGENTTLKIGLVTKFDGEIKVSIAENDGLNIEFDKDIIKAKKNAVLNLEAKVEVPKSLPFKPLWITRIKFEANDKTEYFYIGVLPVSEKSRKEVIIEAKEDDKNFSVGALSTIHYGSTIYLSYRWRNGVKRGEILEIAESKDGISFSPVINFSKNNYGYQSFEQSSFAKNYENKVIFLYSADVGGRWDIFVTEANSVKELELPGRAFIRRGKDPAVLYDRDTNNFIIAYSNGNNVGHDLTIVATNDFASFEVKSNSIVYTQFIKQGNTWARTHIHAGCLIKRDRYYVLFYDALPYAPKSFGSGWLGVAISTDLVNWIDLTPEAPLWRGNGIDNTFRYVDIHCTRERYILYAEEEVSKKGKKDIVAYIEE